MITLPSEIATSAGMFVFAIVQALILLALAPLFSGISRMIRARIQSRRGPGVLQDYRDIAKLMKRQNIWPDNAGWVSKVMPYVLISTVMVVAMSLPLFTRVAPFGAGSDLITVIYLFALFRFFFSIAGLDSNSTFSSLGARASKIKACTMAKTNIPADVAISEGNVIIFNLLHQRNGK
jgi:formate hydrogenlyase subunit 4